MNESASVSSAATANTLSGSEGAMLMPRVLSAASVGATATEMLASQLDKRHRVILDFSHTDTLTSPGLQLLVALEKTLGESNGTLLISEVKSAVAEAFNDLGFERFLKTDS